MRCGCFIIFSYTWGNWGLARLHKLYKVTRKRRGHWVFPAPEHASLEVILSSVAWGPSSMSGSAVERLKLPRWQEAPWDSPGTLSGLWQTWEEIESVNCHHLFSFPTVPASHPLPFHEGCTCHTKSMTLEAGLWELNESQVFLTSQWKSRL